MGYYCKCSEKLGSFKQVGLTYTLGNFTLLCKEWIAQNMCRLLVGSYWRVEMPSRVPGMQGETSVLEIDWKSFASK